MNEDGTISAYSKERFPAATRLPEFKVAEIEENIQLEENANQIYEQQYKHKANRSNSARRDYNLVREAIESNMGNFE